MTVRMVLNQVTSKKKAAEKQRESCLQRSLISSRNQDEDLSSFQAILNRFLFSHVLCSTGNHVDFI
jgi:hypothetical protein